MKKWLFLVILTFCWGVSGFCATPFDEDAVIKIPKKGVTPSGAGNWHVATWVNPQWKNPVNGACEAGYSKTSTKKYGANVCLQCPQGRYIPAKERCVVCKEGYTYNAKSDRCEK